MEFIAAKCPNCAGDLRLPDDKKQVICMYCGFDIFVRDVVGTSGVDISNLLQLAASSEKAGNHQEAYDYFTKVLEYERGNPVALLGKAIAAGNLSTSGNFRFSELNHGVLAAIEQVDNERRSELKVEAAQNIEVVCSNFSIFKLGNSEQDHVVERLAIVHSLELAHDLDPTNVEVIKSLYFASRQLVISMRLSEARLNQSIWKDQLEDHGADIKKWFEKLEAIDPDAAELVQKIEKENRSVTRSVDSTGAGCSTLVACVVIIAGLFLLLLT